MVNGFSEGLIEKIEAIYADIVAGAGYDSVDDEFVFRAIPSVANAKRRSPVFFSGFSDDR